MNEVNGTALQISMHFNLHPICNQSLNDAVICLNIRFKKYQRRGTEYYDDGLTVFSRFHLDDSGELFYPNGILAIRIYRPENRKCN